MSTTTLQTMLGSLVEGVRRIAPYLLIELLLPGGTVMALLLFFARRRRAKRLARAGGCPVHRRQCERGEPCAALQIARAA